MNQNEHIYFTRSKKISDYMNTSQRVHTMDDPDRGITKPIKVHNLKTKISKHKSKHKSKSNKKYKNKKNKNKKSKKNRIKLKTNSKTKFDIVSNISDTIIIKEQH